MVYGVTFETWRKYTNLYLRSFKIGIFGEGDIIFENQLRRHSEVVAPLDLIALAEAKISREDYNPNTDVVVTKDGPSIYAPPLDENNLHLTLGDLVYQLSKGGHLILAKTIKPRSESRYDLPRYERRPIKVHPKPNGGYSQLQFFRLRDVNRLTNFRRLNDEGDIKKEDVERLITQIQQSWQLK